MRRPTQSVSSARRAARSPQSSAFRAATSSSTETTWRSRGHESEAVNKPERMDKQVPTAKLMAAMGENARAAARELALASTQVKNNALRAAANALRVSASGIITANAKDVA